ncbi:MAG: hypothetical protein N3F05_00595 [Candidatus Diapherotrites archaeon]|nr:hypothetical protein [Candidatus Diapherotrites archaeon]
MILLNRRKKFLVMLLLLLIFAISLILVIMHLINPTKKGYEVYLYSYDEIPMKLSDENTPQAIHNTIVVKSTFAFLAGDTEAKRRLAETKPEHIKLIEASFEKKCVVPESCDPNKVLGGYCFSIRVLNRDSNWIEIKQRILDNSKFSKALTYWREYFKKKQLAEDDLDSLYGYVTAEKECGDLNFLDKNIALKILEIKIDKTDPSEQLRKLKTKATTALNIFDKNLSELRKENSKVAAIFEQNICNTMGEIIIKEKTKDLCFVRDYLLIKKLCEAKPLLEQKEEKEVKDAILKKYEKIEDIQCQCAIAILLS